MQIFGWKQSKLQYGRRDQRSSDKKPNSKPVDESTAVAEPGKEEVSEWLYGLLTIGTFGNNDLKEDLQSTNLDGNSPTSPEDHQQGPAFGEVGNLRYEHLNSLLHKKQDRESASEIDLSEQNPLHRQSSLEPERYTGNDAPCGGESGSRSGSLQHSTSLVASRGKDFTRDSAEKAIGKKSVSFLLKKVFVCRSGFPSGPSPRAPVPESRMDKMLRAILHKKIYPQSSSPALPAKKYLLENGNMHNSNQEDISEKADKGSKWVKTDSECNFLF